MNRTLVVLMTCLLSPHAAVATEDVQRYLVVQKLVSEVKIPVIGGVKSTTTVAGWVDVRSDGSRVRGEGPVCDIRVKGTPLISTRFSTGFRRAIGPIRVDATVTPDGKTGRSPRSIVFTGRRFAMSVAHHFRHRLKMLGSPTPITTVIQDSPSGSVDL